MRVPAAFWRGRRDAAAYGQSIPLEPGSCLRTELRHDGVRFERDADVPRVGARAWRRPGGCARHQGAASAEDRLALAAAPAAAGTRRAGAGAEPAQGKSCLLAVGIASMRIDEAERSAYMAAAALARLVRSLMPCFRAWRSRPGRRPGDSWRKRPRCARRRPRCQRFEGGAALFGARCRSRALRRRAIWRAQARRAAGAEDGAPDEVKADSRRRFLPRAVAPGQMRAQRGAFYERAALAARRGGRLLGVPAAQASRRRPPRARYPAHPSGISARVRSNGCSNLPRH